MGSGLSLVYRCIYNGILVSVVLGVCNRISEVMSVICDDHIFIDETEY